MWRSLAGGAKVVIYMWPWRKTKCRILMSEFLIDLTRCVMWGLLSVASGEGNFILAFIFPKISVLHTIKVILFSTWFCEF